MSEGKLKPRRQWEWDISGFKCSVSCGHIPFQLISPNLNGDRSLSPQTLTQICFSKASKQGPLLNHNRHLAAHSLFIVSINIKKLCLYSLLIRYPIISSDYDNSLAKNYRMSTFAIHTCQKWCTSNTLLKCKGIKSGLVFSCSHSLLINFWLNLWFCSGSVPLLTRVCPSLLQITVRLLLLITLLVQTQYDGLLD